MKHWGGIFDIDGKKIQLAEEELAQTRPYGIIPRGRDLDEEKSEIEIWIEGYEQVTSAVGIYRYFWFRQRGEATEEEVDAQYQETIRVLEDIEMRNMLRREEDHFEPSWKSIPEPEVRKVWPASMLYRMYIR